MGYMKEVEKLIREEGLVGLQKLEANGMIRGNFTERIVGNVYRRSNDRRRAYAIARGIGSHSNVEKIIEMIEWLRDDDYLIDYGMITVFLGIAIKREGVPLAESRFKKALDYIRCFENFFCVYFLLKHQSKFSEEFNDWLLEIRDNELSRINQSTMLVKTRFGYSTIAIEKYRGSTTSKDSSMRQSNMQGIHFERYRGTYEVK